MVSLSLFFMQVLSFADKLRDIFNHLKAAGPWFILFAKIGKHVETMWDVFKAIGTILGIKM